MSVRPITDTLRSLGHGVFIDEASEALNQLVNAVESTGRAGKLTLVLSLKKATRNGLALVVQDEIKLQLPKQPARETMLFATPEGNLLTEDPRQQSLELRSVTETPPELKVVPDTGVALKVVGQSS